MHMCTRGHHRMVTETSKITYFRAHFFFILTTKPTHRYNFLYWQVFFRWVKETNETTNLETHFFYNLFFVSRSLWKFDDKRAAGTDLSTD